MTADTQREKVREIAIQQLPATYREVAIQIADAILAALTEPQGCEEPEGVVMVPVRPFKGGWGCGGFATGNYENQCGGCGRRFVGDKRAVRCATCAINGAIRHYAPREGDDG